MGNIPEKQYEQWMSHMGIDGRYNRKNNMIEEIEKVFCDKSLIMNASQLEPSGYLSVRPFSAIVSEQQRYLNGNLYECR